MACQVARRMREKHAALASRLSFVLVERGRKDLTTAARRLTAFGMPVAAHTSLESLPALRGVIYSNELLDALPVHLLEARDGAVSEVFVDAEGRELLAAPSSAEIAARAAALAGALSDGQRHAVCLEAESWIKTAAAKIEEGFLVTIDYGKRFAPGAPNPPRAFRRHAVETELTREPGAFDLTASVDFEGRSPPAAPPGSASSPTRACRSSCSTAA
ncbi:MAG: SAM-dependent methyltransferase [Elusimicrobiota bacterium]|nr:MAG: SAM-dependent methyltransferase [Elusimicrobiota bacterium]